MPEPADTHLDEVRRRARRRLIGAIVLALAAAVLVPMLLESDPKPLGEDVSVRIPPVDSGKFVNRLSEAKAEADAKSAPRKPVAEVEQRVLAPAAKAAAKPEAAAPAPKAAPEPVPQTRTAPEPKAESAAEAKSAAVANDSKAAAPAKEGAFSVQLAAFSDDKGANALASRLTRSGHAAYVEPFETSRGTLWRVRVGPFPSREAAGAARDQLKSEGQNGIVTSK